jgi:tetratricopeptide (TPR) repeat protein
MRSSFVLSLLIISTSATVSAQTVKLADWPTLIKGNKKQAAKQLCTNYVNSSNIAQRVEANKCLANVALMGNDIVLLQGDDNGGGTLSGGYTREAVDESLAHLNTALKLAPQDLSIHEGILHLLEVSGRYSDMLQAIQQSCSIYKGTDAVDAWLPYVGELDDLGQYRVALDFSKVLDKHYPNNPDVIANVGAFLMILGKPGDAIPKLQEAVKLAPKDPINTWDLGRAYDLTDQNELADTWYQKGLSLQTDKQVFRQDSCIYAQFLAEKLHHRDAACDLEKSNCPRNEQTACSAGEARKKSN